MLGGAAWQGEHFAIDVKVGEKENIEDIVDFPNNVLLIQVVIDDNMLMKVERLNDNMEYIIWSYPNDVALWHITALLLYTWCYTFMTFLGAIMMT